MWGSERAGSILFSMMSTIHRPSREFLIVGRFFASLLFLGAIEATCQSSKPPRKQTELVIVQYEKLVAEGALLTPEGWERASKLFDQSVPYPEDGEIHVESTGGLLAEDWVQGDYAQVETKWNEYYGIIDAKLRYTPPSPDIHTPLTIFQTYSLRRQSTGGLSGETGGDWKIEGLRERHATVKSAIKYVEAMRDKSHDPVIRKNANQTIASLRRLSSGCGTASAC